MRNSAPISGRITLFGSTSITSEAEVGIPILIEDDGTLRTQVVLFDGTTQRRELSTSRGEAVSVGGVRKVLGSSAPAATTETVLYTVPAGMNAYVHSLWICNRGAIESMRVGISVGGGALANDDYVLYDVVVPAGDALVWSSEKMWCLAAADEVRIRSSAGNLTYKIFGEEV